MDVGIDGACVLVWWGCSFSNCLLWGLGVLSGVSRGVPGLLWMDVLTARDMASFVVGGYCTLCL